MKVRNEISQERLHELFDYKDGQLIWKMSRGGSAKKGSVAGHKIKLQYIQVVVDRKTYYLHRLIFVYHHGYCPHIVDHIDADQTNNRIENLREATQQQNCFNSKINKNTSTGMKNVNWNTEANKYRVELSVNGKNKFIGYYVDPELAELVAIEARDKYHGRFARHG
jgi:hypothetical protein